MVIHVLIYSIFRLHLLAIFGQDFSTADYRLLSTIDKSVTLSMSVFSIFSDNGAIILFSCVDIPAVTMSKYSGPDM